MSSWKIIALLFKCGNRDNDYAHLSQFLLLRLKKRQNDG